MGTDQDDLVAARRTPLLVQAGARLISRSRLWADPVSGNLVYGYVW
jgi:hypothetical protein